MNTSASRSARVANSSPPKSLGDGREIVEGGRGVGIETVRGGEPLLNCESEKQKVKLRLVSRISRWVRRAGLDYDGWRYVSLRVRKDCSLKPAKKGRRLPGVLTQADFRRFYVVVD
jgi:hypothetical protein